MFNPCKYILHFTKRKINQEKISQTAKWKRENVYKNLLSITAREDLPYSRL